jgi:hypothetical protein
MKTFLKTLFFFLLFLITAFSQDIIHRGVISDKPINERIREIHKPSVNDLHGLNDKESLLLKSKSSHWQTVARNPKKEFYEADEFNAKDSRITINKTLLDNGFLVIEYIQQEWDGSAWVNNEKYSFTYDGNNNRTEQIFQNWDGSVWVNSSKYSLTYDGNNNRTEQISQTWNGSAWVNSSKYSVTYNGNNNRTEQIFQTCNGSAWVNNWKYSYTYDGNNNLTEWLYQEWYGSAWVNNEKYSLTYDGNNNPTVYLVQNWDGSAWVNNWKYSFTYDGNNNRTEQIFQTWDGSAWVNNEKYSFTYDGNNNRTEQIFQTWDGSAWVNNWKYSFTYDGNNNRTEQISQTWNGSAWVNVGKYTYSYIPTGIEQFEGEVSTYSLSNNYPNPFNPTTRISYTIPKRSNVNIKVYSLLGSEVAELVKGEMEAGSYDIEFNAANLPSGVYFYRIQSGNFIDTKKMLLLK